MFLRILIGLVILLGTIGVGLAVGYALHSAGKLANVGTDKTQLRAAIVTSREAVRRRVAEARHTPTGSR